jgi:hypothetical protein
MAEVLTRVLAFTEACTQRIRKSMVWAKGRNMMGRGPKVILWACCAVAATILSGAGTAAATPISLTAAQRTVTAVSVAASQSDCNSSQAERWNLNGANNVDVAYDGLGYVYSVTFTQNGSCLTGTLDDPYYPTSGPISGTINGDSITFTFDYPPGSIQGTRTYTGTISQSGTVSGTWTQTGDESPDNGTWTLAAPASGTVGKACVFNAPTGVAVFRGHEIFGHVGWGFELPNGNWDFGANEGSAFLGISKTWYAEGTWQRMLNVFSNSGFYHSAGHYTQYKCATVKTTSTDIADARAIVAEEYHEYYYPPTHDCESQVYNVLAAYGVKDLPSDMARLYWPSPNNWFDNLSSAGFGRAIPL